MNPVHPARLLCESCVNPHDYNTTIVVSGQGLLIILLLLLLRRLATTDKEYDAKAARREETQGGEIINEDIFKWAKGPGSTPYGDHGGPPQ